jgi:ribonuclease D
MKKLFILPFFAIVLLACNSQHGRNWNANNPASDKHQDATESEKLVLNNGAKWKVDDITSSNVKNLQVIVKGFESGNDKSLQAYKKADDDLQNGLTKMISECKMQGPDHEALHKWLEPLMEDVAKLKQASAENIASQSFAAIKVQADLYNQYFE